MTKYSNEEILRGILEHDEKILLNIYNTNYDKIENLVLSNNGTTDEAADVFQDSLIIVYNKVRNQSLVLTAHFDTYLYAVAKMVWKALLRKKIINVPAENYSEKLVNEEDILSNLMENERHKLVWKYFNKLSADCQKVIQLFNDGKSIREITAIMKYSSEQYTKNRRAKCKDRLIENIMKDPRYNELINHKYHNKPSEN